MKPLRAGIVGERRRGSCSAASASSSPEGWAAPAAGTAVPSRRRSAPSMHALAAAAPTAAPSAAACAGMPASDVASAASYAAVCDGITDTSASWAAWATAASREAPAGTSTMRERRLIQPVEAVDGVEHRGADEGRRAREEHGRRLGAGGGDGVEQHAIPRDEGVDALRLRAVGHQECHRHGQQRRSEHLLGRGNQVAADDRPTDDCEP